MQEGAPSREPHSHTFDILRGTVEFMTSSRMRIITDITFDTSTGTVVGRGTLLVPQMPLVLDVTTT